MSNLIEDYLRQKKIAYKVVGGTDDPQALFTTCPFCKDSDGTHFYMSLGSGQYYCHKCSSSGSLTTLKQHYGDIANIIQPLAGSPKVDIGLDMDDVARDHAALLMDKGAQLYLAGRMFTADAIRYFQLGVREINGVKYLCFPYIGNGQLKNIKYRTLPPHPKGFMRLTGGESSLYNEDALSGKIDSIIICEGESDTIAVWSRGFHNVIGVSVGAKSIKSEWIEQLDKFQKVYIVFDNDDAGSVGAQKLANRLGIERCYNVALPTIYKDVNDYLKVKSAIDFQDLISNAAKFDVDHVKSVWGLIQDKIRSTNVNESEIRLELPWGNVNKLLNGFVAGDLIVIAGKPGVGKSTFGFNLLYYWARMGIPVLLFTLEMPPWRILPRIIALHKHMDSRLCNDLDVMSSVAEELRGLPLYMAYKYDRPSWNFIADTIRHCVKRYGIQFLVFDNLHFLCRSLTRQTEEVSVNIQNFKLLAEELAIPIVVIARPRKTSAKVISGEDLKDSADIEGDSDIIIILARDRKKGVGVGDVEGNFVSDTLVVVDKCRFSAGGATFLQAFDDEARFDTKGG